MRHARRRWWARRILQAWHRQGPPPHPGIEHQRPEWKRM